jgi:hypothetical protein
MNKRIITISVVSVLWLLVSQVSFAEMTLIDDEEMSSVTGQQGLTIDIEMGLEVGEFMYQDAGSIVMQGMRLGGMDHRSGEVGTQFDGGDGLVADALDPTGFGGRYGGNTGLNNVRIIVDVAGDGSDIGNNGSIANPVTGVPIGLPDNFFRWAWGEFTNAGAGGAVGCGDNGNCRFSANDGDLFIHATPSDASASGNGTALTIADFGMELDKFAIKDSTYIAGDDLVDRSGTSATAQSTTILSNLKMEGYFGGFDLLLENKGNGFGVYDAAGGFTETGVGSAASKIKVNTFFEITEMEYDFNIAGIRYEKMSIHNKRGDFLIFDFLSQDDYALGPNVSTTQGFAQSNTQIFAIKDAVLHVGAPALGTNPANFRDGIAMNTRFQGDMDIGHLSFGDTGVSIGSLYYTDMDFTTNHVISAH